VHTKRPGMTPKFSMALVDRFASAVAFPAKLSGVRFDDS
jgi:hypothetical protein